MLVIDLLLFLLFIVLLVVLLIDEVVLLDRLIEFVILLLILVLIILVGLFFLLRILFVLIIELKEGNMLLWKFRLFGKRILWFGLSVFLSMGLVYSKLDCLFELRILLICLKVFGGRKCLFKIFFLVEFCDSLWI